MRKGGGGRTDAADLIAAGSAGLYSFIGGLCLAVAVWGIEAGNRDRKHKEAMKSEAILEALMVDINRVLERKAEERRPPDDGRAGRD